MSSPLKFALIGGTGLGDALGLSDPASYIRHVVPTPFGSTSSDILETTWPTPDGPLPVLLLKRHGDGHLLNPTTVPYRANIYALKSLGVTHILASGAVGSLREEIKPRDLVIVDQVIDKTTKRPNTFFESAAVHVEFAHPFCPALRNLLTAAAKDLPDTKVHTVGTYVCMEGPAFSTRAESLMHRLWGGDVIGMTAMPEARLAREAEIAYALLALSTDFDCWKSHPPRPVSQSPDQVELSLLQEIIGHLQSATTNALELLKHAITLAPSHQTQLLASPALHALKLAIWSDKSRIPPPEVQRLHTLWGKYFTP